MSAEGKAAGKAAEHIIAKAVEGAGVRESKGIVARIEHVGGQAVRDAEDLAVRDALARGESRSPRQILSDMENDQISRLTGEQRERITRTLETAKANEQRITPRLSDIASRSGMQMQGLENSVKGQRSLERKLGGKLADLPMGSPAHENRFTHQLSQANDVVRYTMTAPEGEYAAATTRAVQEMKDRGFVQEVVKNNWTDPTGYRGVNSTWLDPATGQRFELQFHTPESLAAKEVTHPIYDFSRVADPQLRPQFDGLQNRVFDKVPIPEGTTMRGDPQWLAGGGTS